MLRVIDYSEKAIALIGETFSIKEDIKKLGGTFNKSLSIENTKTSGWIFPINKKQDLENFIKTIPSDKLKSTSKNSSTVNDIKSSISIDPKITHEMFANLLNKYEILEARLQFIENSLSLNNSTSKSSSVIKNKTKFKKDDSSEDESESQQEIKPKRFLADL